MKVVIPALLFLGIAVAGLWLWRLNDHRADRREWLRLAAIQPARFTPEMATGPPRTRRALRSGTTAPATS